MPVITSLKPQKNQKRFNVYLDGKFGFALSVEALAKVDLKVNQKISEKEIKKLINEDIKDKLYNRTLQFLSYRARSEREVRDYLKKKGGEVKMVETIIKKLEDQGLIDDRAFAAWWIEQRSRFRPKGRYLISIELLKKGIKKEIIETSLFSEKEELDLAKKAARKKVKRYDRQKMVGFLSRRGFNWDIIKKVLEEIQKKR